MLLNNLTYFVELTAMLILRLRLRCCSLLLQSVLGAVSASGQHIPVAVRLTIWLYSTHLETRTNESNVCASSWVAKPTSAMEVIAEIRASTSDRYIETCLSSSISVRTRKMVNYA